MNKKSLFLKYGLVVFLGWGASACVPETAQAATKVFLHDALSPQGKRATAGVGYGCYNSTNDSLYRVANTTQGSSTVIKTFAPATSTTPCRMQSANGPGAQYLTWITPPISAVVTISGNIDYSIGCAESAVNLNLGMTYIIQRWSHSTGGIMSSVVDSAAVATECGTTLVRKVIAASAPTATTTFQIGDKIIIYLDVIGIGGSFNGNGSRTASVAFDGVTGGTGDSFVNFSDDISFGADAAGVQAFVK